MEELVTEMMTALFELECKEFKKEFPKENVREELECGNRFLSAGALEMEVTDTLTVTDLPYSMTEEQTRAEFAKHGINVVNVKIRDNYSKTNKRGHRFLNREVLVKLSSAAAVENAVEVMNGITVTGSKGKPRQITVATSDVQLKADTLSPKKKTKRREQGRVSGGAGDDRASGGAHGGRASGGAHGGRASGGAHGGRASGGAHGGRASGGAHGGRASGGAHGGRASGGAGGGRASGGARRGEAAAQPKKGKGAGSSGGADATLKQKQGKGGEQGGEVSK
jgi:hypothetical protein